MSDGTHLGEFMDAAVGYRAMPEDQRPLVAHQVVAAVDEIDRLRAIETAALKLVRNYSASNFADFQDFVEKGQRTDD